MPVRPIVFGGTHTLVRQSYDAKEMGHGVHNADGYGVGWYHKGRPVRIREARPIWHDPDLKDVLSVRALDLLAGPGAERQPGIPLDKGEVAPFVFKRWSFGLNGYVRKFHTHAMRPLRSTLPDELYTQIRGTSDTETLFLLAIAEVWQGASLGMALARVGERACSLGVPEQAEHGVGRRAGSGRDPDLQHPGNQLAVRRLPGIARSGRHAGRFGAFG